MVPPGPLTYYYTIDGKRQYLDKNAEQKDSARVLHDAALDLLKLEVPKTNIIENIIQNREPITETYLTSMRVIPRPPPVILKGRMKLKTPWDILKSVFKAYKPDNQRIVDDCFEVDWANTKCEKILKGDGEAAKVKAYIKRIYKVMRETYKYYAGLQPLGRIMCVGSGTLTEILYNCGNFIDGKVLKISDVDLQVIACNGGRRAANPLDPDKALVRCQFIEVLVRLSQDKYAKTGIAESPSAAVEMAFETNFLPYFETFNCHNWRKERLWREEIDLIFSRFLDKLEALYKRYTGKYATPGSNKQHMSLEEFVQLLSDGGLLNEHFGNREAGPLWNLAMMTNKDELTSDKHLQMTFVEFLEALARVADKFDMQNMEDFFPDYKAKSPFQLDKKLESTMLTLMSKLLQPKQYKAQHGKYKQLVQTELDNLKLGLVTQFARA